MPFLNAELWAPVSGYEGFYEVSSRGRVRSLPRLSHSYGGRLRRDGGLVLKPVMGHSGYIVQCLCKKGARKNYRLHRLVAAAFLSGAEPGAQVNHLDGDKTNNCVENLAWASGHENMRHATETGLIRRGEGHPRRKLSEPDVRSIRAARASGSLIREISDKYKISKGMASAICTRRAWRHI